MFLNKIKKLPFRKFKWLTLFTAGSFIVLILLGTWQIQRLVWKNSLIKNYEIKAQIPAVHIPSEDIGIGEWEFRKVLLDGEFLNKKEIHVGARYYKEKMGFNILTPFRLEDGRTIIVNRGWVSLEYKEPETRIKSQISGNTSIEGIILKPLRKGAFTPDNNLERNYWFWMDMEAMKGFTGLDFAPYIVQETSHSTLSDFPVKLTGDVKFLNDHLQYAVTWYLLSIVLLAIYFAFLYKNIVRTTGKKRKKLASNV